MIITSLNNFIIIKMALILPLTWMQLTDMPSLYSFLCNYCATNNIPLLPNTQMVSSEALLSLFESYFNNCQIIRRDYFENDDTSVSCLNNLRKYHFALIRTLICLLEGSVVFGNEQNRNLLLSKFLYVNQNGDPNAFIYTSIFNGITPRIGLPIYEYYAITRHNQFVLEHVLSLENFKEENFFYNNNYERIAQCTTIINADIFLNGI